MTILVDQIIPPVGRFVERATVAATAPDQLKAGDPVFAAGDALKLIAIPGAVDLNAEIVDLGEYREVRNATMTAGTNVLNGTLFDPKENAANRDEPFKQDVHVQRRVTVEQAGPGGSTLLTTIKRVINGTSVELVDDATNTVSGVKVVVNRPDLAVLSNYARRKVFDLVVDLGNRTINDGAMELGTRGLQSSSAAFSSFDLQKHVTIVAAGLHVTTIKSVTSPTVVELTAPVVHDVKDVPVDVWVVDEPAAGAPDDAPEGFAKVVAAFNAAGGEGEMVFGPGVWDFARPKKGPRINGLVDLRGLRNVTLRGAGEGASILRLMPNQDLGRAPGVPDTHVLEAIDCRNLTIRDLSVHGAYLTLANAQEQMHGIVLTQDCETVKIDRVRVFQTAGDGIRLIGATRKVRNVSIDRCSLVQNKRSGIAVQRNVEALSVHRCYIEMHPPSTDSSIDLEPTGTGGPTDIIFTSNLIDHGTRATAVSLSGIKGPDPARRVIFANNVLLHGNVFCTDVDSLSITGNLIIVSEDDNPRNRVPIHVQRGGHALVVTGNILVNGSPHAEAVIKLSQVNQRGVTRSIVGQNVCSAVTQTGIHIDGCDDIAVDGNLVTATGACTYGIVAGASSGNNGSISITNNTVTVEAGGAWESGVRAVAGARSFRRVSIHGNNVRGATEGIALQGGNFQQLPVVTANVIDDDVPNPLVGLGAAPQHVPVIVVGGATSRSGGRTLLGFADPNSPDHPNIPPIPGILGDTYQRVGDGAGPRLYVREFGDEAEQPWAPK